MPEKKHKPKIRKRFKIGESAIGGIIEITLDQTLILIECIDWSTKETLSDAAINILNPKWKQHVSDILLDLTTTYYTDKCMDWIALTLNMQETRAKVELRQEAEEEETKATQVGTA